MKARLASLTLVELVVVLAVLVVLGALFLAACRARFDTESRRKSCQSNLHQIAMACFTYQEPNGDFFPCHWDGMFRNGNQNDGSDPVHAWQGYDNPMQSLALLYPVFVDNCRIFRCPTTKDEPQIAIRNVGLARHACFGPDPEGDGLIEFGGRKYDPADFSGKEAGLPQKCSYMYDSLSHFRDIGPSQAMAADADGYVYRLRDGSRPPYPARWRRLPRQPNHDSFQNVMYFDGHVKGFLDNNYCSDDPCDNIFARNGTSDTPSGQWGRDTDAVVWDEANYPGFDAGR